MVTPCFARALERGASCVGVHFLLTLQEVTPIRKTRNQLNGIDHWRQKLSTKEPGSLRSPAGRASRIRTPWAEVVPDATAGGAIFLPRPTKTGTRDTRARRTHVSHGLLPRCGRDSDAYERITLCHILPEVRSICKTRNQLTA